MNQQQLLQLHPSVQDLAIAAPAGATNPNKAHFHKLVINSGPLHQPSDSGLKKKRVAKDQTVKIVKNEANLLLAAQCRSDVGKFQVTNTATNDKSMASAGKNLGSSLTGSNKKKHDQANDDKLPPLPPASTSSGSVPKVVGGNNNKQPCCEHKHNKRPTSGITASIVSVDDGGSEAESFSMYSCSCCHVRPGSSRNSNFSEYEHMTSISQRPSNHPSAVGGKAASVTSTKLRSLESELNKEREDRERTQKELELIKQRQNFLLSRLTEEERLKLSSLMQQQDEQKKP